LNNLKLRARDEETRGKRAFKTGQSNESANASISSQKDPDISSRLEQRWLLMATVYGGCLWALC
jgi:hypothetical protein